MRIFSKGNVYIRKIAVKINKILLFYINNASVYFCVLLNILLLSKDDVSRILSTYTTREKLCDTKIFVFVIESNKFELFTIGNKRSLTHQYIYVSFS